MGLMTESEWISIVVKILSEKLSKYIPNINIGKGKKLRYAYEVQNYENEKPIEPYSMNFETDILIFETSAQNKWKPRIIIEGKINSITTHDAITYGQKAMYHKNIHPYLRYGILIGNLNQLPGRLFRHGSNFDFMMAWENYEPSNDEINILLEIIKNELKASSLLEDILFHPHTSGKKSYITLHRPLELR